SSINLLSAPLTILLICCHINRFRRASRCAEAMARRRKEEQPAGIASRGIWGSRRYRRKIYGKLQLICNQYVAGGILWESAPLRCCRNEGSQTPCEIRPYTRIDFKALRKLVEPWLQSMLVATSTTVKKLPITPGTPIMRIFTV